jgi:hypothetical protein
MVWSRASDARKSRDPELLAADFLAMQSEKAPLKGGL